MGRFGGYLIKAGDFTVPMEYINEKGYSAPVNTIDEDSYTDNFGVLNRTVINKIPIVTVSFIEMNDEELDVIMSGFRRNYLVPDERKLRVSLWVPEYRDYVEQDMFIKDPDFPINNIDLEKNVINYDAFSLKFEGYGE